MKGTHLGVQAAIVLVLVALVSWPQYRPVRAQSIWRLTPAGSRQAQTDDLGRVGRSGDERPVVGFGRAADYVSSQPSEQPATIPGVADAITPRVATPISVAALGGKSNALVGFARTSLNLPIPYARVALRNIRTARVEASATANDEGRFSFLDVDPSAYIVELLGTDGSVIATSEMIALARGDVKETTVRTPASAAKVVSAFNGNLNGTLSQTTDVADASDVTRTSSNLISQESPNNPLGGAR